MGGVRGRLQCSLPGPRCVSNGRQPQVGEDQTPKQRSIRAVVLAGARTGISVDVGFLKCGSSSYEVGARQTWSGFEPRTELHRPTLNEHGLTNAMTLTASLFPLFHAHHLHKQQPCASSISLPRYLRCLPSAMSPPRRTRRTGQSWSAHRVSGSTTDTLQIRLVYTEQ